MLHPPPGVPSHYPVSITAATPSSNPSTGHYQFTTTSTPGSIMSHHHHTLHNHHHLNNNNRDSNSDSEDEESSKDGSGIGAGEGGNGVGGDDAEGVWSPDIEQSFQEALAIYPPCGRRKIILSDEGKMYGRNELIARYIKIRTGKTRTRKQVSSHIQVLARRKAREMQAKIKSKCPVGGGGSSGSLGGGGSNNNNNLPPPTTSSSTPSSLSSQMHHPPSHLSHLGLHPAAASHVATAAAGLAALGIAASAAAGHPVASYPGVGSHFWQPAGPTTVGSDIKPFGDASSSANSKAAAAFAASLHHSHAINNNNHLHHSSSHNNNSSLISINNRSNHNNNNNWPDNIGRCISSSRLRLLEFIAYADCGPETEKHYFVEIGPTIDNGCYPGEPGLGSNNSPSQLEDIDLRQISDKFPTNKGGLKDLYDEGPQDAFFLVKFWADLNIPPQLEEADNSFYGVSSHLESLESMELTCSTKVCSFGKQVVEKIEAIEDVSFVNGHYIYRLDRSEMCPYMINFIHKLKDLPEKYMMNSVLENFTILQVISHRHTNETLLCIAFVFEISDNDVGPSHNIYRLVKPSESSSNSSSSPTTTSSSSTSSSSSSSSATSASSASTVRGNIRV